MRRTFSVKFQAVEQKEVWPFLTHQKKKKMSQEIASDMCRIRSEDSKGIYGRQTMAKGSK